MDEKGLAMDRKWMIVGAKNHKFVTQREFPKMSLLSARITEDQQTLILSAPGKEDFSIEIDAIIESTESSERYKVEIWRKEFDALDLGDEVAQWLSSFFGKEVRLVQTPENHQRSPNEELMAPFKDLEVKPGNNTTFADGFPLLLGAETSMEDLNERIVKQGHKAIDIIRFRPNIVVSGSERAYEEDEWHTIKFGDDDRVMYNVKPCTRCTVPNVNPQEGIKDIPVRDILIEYRLSERFNEPIFCINLAHSTACAGKMLRVGDKLTVEKTQPAPLLKNK